MTELDSQVDTVLAEMEAGNVPPIQALSTDGARALLRDLFVRDDQSFLPDEVSMQNLTIPGPKSEIPVRVYRPDGDSPFPALVYFHGGGWVVGGLNEYDDICAKLAARAGRVVVSVDYRMAPEHPFPAAVEDSYTAAEWVADHTDLLDVDPDRIAVGGDSAGGNLTAAVTLMARDRDGPAFEHQLLIYPAVDSLELHHHDSYDENGEGYFLEYAGMKWFYERYIADAADNRNEYAFPLLARDLSGLPPATVLTAGFDPLRDEGMAYAERLADAGVPVDHQHHERMIHGFVSLSEEVDTGDDAIDHLAAQLNS
ncbi:alpha/beta hydrolase [Halosegnis sp.]|uniref:alpha/beta hydrolase n=1 Tax=Halosegnis sp. TaxID=2864959 RepID=UPI0035D4434E